MVDSNCIDVLVCVYVSFFFLFFLFFDKIAVVSESEKYNGLDNFYLLKFLNLYYASRLLTSDSENAFICFENIFCVICLCLLIIFLFFVCRFVLIYSTVCVCGVITKSYF